MLSNLTT